MAFLDNQAVSAASSDCLHWVVVAEEAMIDYRATVAHILRYVTCKFIKINPSVQEDFKLYAAELSVHPVQQLEEQVVVGPSASLHDTLSGRRTPERGLARESHLSALHKGASHEWGHDIFLPFVFSRHDTPTTQLGYVLSHATAPMDVLLWVSPGGPRT